MLEKVYSYESVVISAESISSVSDALRSCQALFAIEVIAQEIPPSLGSWGQRAGSAGLRALLEGPAVAASTHDHHPEP